MPPHDSEEINLINTLPDDIFRVIFAFCLSSYRCPFDRFGYWLSIKHTTTWQRLVHVCQRWRHIIYGSPLYLDLHLYCSTEKSFRKDLSRWPEFPIIVDYIIFQGEDNVIAALEIPDRVHRMNLVIPFSDEAEELLEMMQVPFSALTYLDLTGPENEDSVLDLPARFLGGCAPRLQHLRFTHISFPALPKLLLSARGLVSLELGHTPATGYGYISPEEMVGGLAGLNQLRDLCIKFQSTEDPPSYDQHEKRALLDLPLAMHADLPALTNFEFSGESQYLEGLVAKIDAPRVEDVEIEYFTSEVETSQLAQFIGRTANLELSQFKRAQVTCCPDKVYIKLDRLHGASEGHQVSRSLTVTIPYPENLQAQCMARVLGQLVAMLSNVDHLSVIPAARQYYWHWKDENFANIEWLPLLRLFPAVEALHVSRGLAAHIASTLEHVADSERISEVLPALHLLWFGDGDELVGSPERILSLRQLSGHPVTVVNTQEEFADMARSRTRRSR